MNVGELIVWLRNVAPARKQGQGNGFAFNMDGLSLIELNERINEAAAELERLTADIARMGEALKALEAELASERQQRMHWQARAALQESGQ